MAIETLLDLYHARGRVHFRCAYGRREGLKSIRECTFRYEPDLMTMMITRGRRCEIVDLKRKMRCPMCGSLRVTVGVTLPRQPNTSALKDALDAQGIRQHCGHHPARWWSAAWWQPRVTSTSSR